MPLLAHFLFLWDGCVTFMKSAFILTALLLAPLVGRAQQPSQTRHPFVEARWIGFGDPAMDHVDSLFAFRKRLELAAKPMSGQVRVTADTRYMLWVNGQFVERGAARGFPWAQPYDELDLAPLLREGANWTRNGALHWGKGFAPGAQAQLCGSSVNWLLTSYVLGIRPTKPGFSEAIFDPRPGDLVSAKGSVPTPHGLIKVEWQRKGEAIEARIEMPKDVRVRSPNLKVRLQTTEQA